MQAHFHNSFRNSLSRETHSSSKLLLKVVNDNKGDMILLILIIIWKISGRPLELGGYRKHFLFLPKVVSTLGGSSCLQASEVLCGTSQFGVNHVINRDVIMLFSYPLSSLLFSLTNSTVGE